MICPHCQKEVVRHPLTEFPASLENCPACGIRTHIEGGHGFTVQIEQLSETVFRYGCTLCGHVREVTYPAP